MSTFFKVCSWLLATACSTSLGAVCTGEWDGGGVPDDNWSVPGNWSTGCSPQADGDSASFGITGPTAINLDIPVTLTNLTFENPSQDYTISGTDTITMQSFAAVSPTMNVDSGTQTFNQPGSSLISIAPGDTLFLSVDGTLNLSTNFGTGSGDLSIDGTGTINNNNFIIVQNFVQNGATINNEQYISGNVTNTVNGGILNNSSNFAEAGSLVVNGGVINNQGDISPPSGLTMTGGILNNQGSASPSELTMDGGAFNNAGFITLSPITVNSGTFTNQAGGEVLDAAFITVNGGTLINQSGSSTAIVSSGPITINGGTVINQTQSSEIFTADVLTINGGLVQNDGDMFATSATVNSPGVATGIGFFDQPFGQSFTNNGTVIPGDPGAPPAPLFFSTYAQTAAGDLTINVLDSKTYGSIISEFDTTLDGTLTVAPSPGFSGSALGTPLTIVTNLEGVLSGTFSNIVDLFPPSVSVEVTYFPNSVVLELFPILSSFISLKEVTFSTINQVNLLLTNHMDRMVDPCCCPEYCVQFYVDPLGSTGKVHSKNNIAGYRFNTGGVLVGLDAFLSEGGVGVAFDYERIYSRGFNDFGSFASNRYHFSGYGTYLIDSCLQLDAIVGAGWESNRLNRSTGVFGNELTRGNPGGDSFDAFLSAEYFVNFCGMNFIPLAGLQYIYYRIHQFEENGVDFFNFAYDAQHYDSLRPFLGFKFNCPFNIGCFEIVPQINAAWQYECLDRSKTLVATNSDFFGLTTPFRIPRGGQNIVLAGADVAVLYDGYTLDFSYEYEGNKRYYNHFFYLELAAAF